MENCIFCKMAGGEIKPEIIWEDEKYLAFLDNNPIKPGHTQVIPKKHTSYIFDLDNDEYSKLMLVSKKISELLKKKLNPKRIGMLVEGFGVDHVHVHLVPINNGGEVCLAYSKSANREELKKIASKILN